MTKTQRPKNGKKRKGGRQPVAYVEHPDMGVSVDGLRVHKSTGRYYRINDDKVGRHYYPKSGRIGLAYLRRAIFEHTCWLNGQEPTDSVQVRAAEPAHDEFGAELPVDATFDADGRAVNVTQIGRAQLVAYFREQLSNPLTRKEFAEAVGYPELVNLEAIEAPPEPLTLNEIIERYITDKSFARVQQATDARRIWKLFAESIRVDDVANVSGDGLQRYRKAVESFALRTQMNCYKTVQGILNHAVAVFKVHRTKVQELKLEVRLNCQNWSQDKKRKARKSSPKPMKPEQFRTLLAQAETESAEVYGMLIAAANFAMHGSEAADLRWDEIDLDKGELYNERTKTYVGRSAIVWDETSEALKAIKRTNEYVFPNGDGLPMTINKVNRIIRKLRKAAKLPDTVVFDGIRDMSRTAMGAENRVAIAWVMGHSLGEDDSYAYRDPQETRQALTKARNAILGTQKG